MENYPLISAGLWSIVPPLLAIVLALITKEVIFSLVLGIISGILIYGCHAGFGFGQFVASTTDVLTHYVGSNAAMIVFLALLGALVALITRAGGAKAYGAWAAKKLSTKRSVTLTTVLLGVIIFIDDYFNCLTVGTVMKPVTDRQHISREKLAYLIDSTAAPVCIIAPISSWAASVSGYFPAEAGINGIEAFVMSIPFNFYALLTIFMIIWMALRKNGDYGPMAQAEARAATAMLNQDSAIMESDDLARLETSDSGIVFDLIGPVIVLVVVCIAAMLYYGGLGTVLEDGSKKDFINAFADTNASAALALGGFITLIATFFFYIPRRLISFKTYFESVAAGIKAMVPALMILALAWTIAGVCRYMLGTGEYVATLVRDSNMPVAIIPAIMFAVACVISFSTGTAWGTFGILIPITIAVCYKVAPHLTIPTLSAVMGGAVFGDHCSPISDTTILSSTGAGCNHLRHVATQIPYAATVAVACFIGYIITGFVTQSLTANIGTDASLAESVRLATGHAVFICFPITLALLVAALIILPKFFGAKQGRRE